MQGTKKGEETFRRRIAANLDSSHAASPPLSNKRRRKPSADQEDSCDTTRPKLPRTCKKQSQKMHRTPVGHDKERRGSTQSDTGPPVVEVDDPDDPPTAGSKPATAADIGLILDKLNKVDGKLSGMEKNIASELKVLSNEMDKVEHSLSSQIAENKERIANVDKDARQMEARLLQEIEKRTGNAFVTNELSKEEKYLSARKSLRIWPMKLPDRNHLGIFLASYLAFNDEEIESLGEVTCSKTRNPARGIVDECLVRFDSIQDRDFVQSRAPNLARSVGKAGLRLEIPDHIHWVFKLLEKESWAISKRWPGAKRNIRFDDANRSFFLDVKIQGGNWERIYPSQVQKALTARKEDGPSKCISTILGIGPEVLLDGGQE